MRFSWACWNWHTRNRNTVSVPGALEAHAGEAGAEIGALSEAWLRAGRRHAGLSAGAQREPDWTEVEAEARRTREEAKEVGEVTERVFGYR